MFRLRDLYRLVTACQKLHGRLRGNTLGGSKRKKKKGQIFNKQLKLPLRFIFPVVSFSLENTRLRRLLRSALLFYKNYLCSLNASETALHVLAEAALATLSAVREP